MLKALFKKKSKINYKKRAFTLIELILVIIVIGVLAGMALPKFIGVQRNAKVATLLRDMDVIKKGIILYNNRSKDGTDYPFVDNTDTNSGNKYKLIDSSEIKEEVLNIITKDEKYINGDEIYQVDFKKLYEEDIQRIKNKDKTYYYLVKSEILFINDPIEDGDGNSVIGPDIEYEDIKNEDKSQNTIPQSYTWGNFKIDEDKDVNTEIEMYIWDAIGTKEDLSGDPNLFDGDKNTRSSDGIIELNKDLSGNTLVLNNYVPYSSSSSVRYEMLDENREKISFFDLVNNVYTDSLIAGSRNDTIQIAIPSDAKYVKYSGTYAGVQEVNITNNSTKNGMINITNKVVFQSNNIKWDAVPNSKGYFLFYDDKFLGYTTSTSYSLAYDKTKENQVLYILPLSNNNIVNSIYSTTLNPVQEVISGDKGIFDNTENTKSKNNEIILLKDLTGKTVKLKNSYSHTSALMNISILDEDNKKLSFIDTVNNKTTTELTVGGYGYTGDVYLVIPPNAKKIKYVGDGQIIEVSVLNKKKDIILGELKQETIDQAIKISFDKPSDLKGYYLFYNNNFYTYNTSNVFHIAYDESLESQRVEIIPIDNDNNTSTVYYFDLIKPNLYLNADLSLFDKNTNTGLKEGSIKFRRDLTGQKVKIIPNYADLVSFLTINIKDSNGNKLEFTDPIDNNKVTEFVGGGRTKGESFSIIIPPNAAEITFSSISSAKIAETYLDLSK